MGMMMMNIPWKKLRTPYSPRYLVPGSLALNRQTARPKTRPEENISIVLGTGSAPHVLGHFSFNPSVCHHIQSMNHKFLLTKSNIGKHTLTLNLLNYYKINVDLVMKLINKE